MLKSCKSFWGIFSLFIFSTSDFYGADELVKYQQIQFSYIFGGQVYNNNYLYNPGFSVQASYGYMITGQAGFGIGLGYQALEKERFIPVYIEAIGYRNKKDGRPFVNMQAGYSYGTYSGSVDMNNYSYKGGVYFQVGLGRKFNIGNHYSVMFQGSYRHQFATMHYEPYPARVYSEVVNYDMLVFSFGFKRQKSE